MARYIGPRSKISRRFGEPIFGFSKALEKKNYPPGMHGTTRKRGKKSEYSVQLQEKQKAKYIYGVLERQFAVLFQRASRAKGVTGEVLLQLMEARLDNVVYRMGIAPTRRGARQLVSHRHITVNGGIVNIASYTLKAGDTVAVREKSKVMEAISGSVASSAGNYPWLEFDKTALVGKMTAIPERSQIPENIREQLIVELYSK